MQCQSLNALPNVINFHRHRHIYCSKIRSGYNIVSVFVIFVYFELHCFAERHETSAFCCSLEGETLLRSFFLIKPTDTLISQIYFVKKLYVSGSSSAHHQEFSTVHSALVYVMHVWWHIPVPNLQWKTLDDGQRNCPKHVEFLDKINSGI